MKFAEILPRLLSGEFVRLRRKPLDFPLAKREYFRLGDCGSDALEHIVEFDVRATNAPAKYAIFHCSLTRNHLIRDDWEVVKDPPKHFEKWKW